MSEERLQEIKDSIEFQYTLAKAKGYDNALLFTNEEEELVEEIDRLNNMIERLNNQLQQKENIIKEVREYIDTKTYHGDCIIPTTILELKDKDYYKLIAILDKGE